MVDSECCHEGIPRYFFFLGVGFLKQYFVLIFFFPFSFFALRDFLFIAFVRYNSSSFTSDCIVCLCGWRYIDFHLLTLFRCTFSGRITAQIRIGSLRGMDTHLSVGE